MKLTIRSIITAEKLLNKPFSDFDLSVEEDLKALIYAVYVVNEKVFTLKDFDSLWELKSERAKMMKFITTQLEYVQQFAEEGEARGKVWITDLVNRLIATRRVDQSYILNYMWIWELNDILKASEDAVKEEMEEKRYWAFLTIMPHVDSKKVSKPQDLITFAWEAEKIEADRLEQLKQDEEMFYKFFNSKPL